jgi:hypothetical protein
MARMHLTAISTRAPGRATDSTSDSAVRLALERTEALRRTRRERAAQRAPMDLSALEHHVRETTARVDRLY